MNETVLLVLLVEMGIAALVWTAFPIHYHLRTHGAWRRNDHGKNVMALAVCLAVMVDATLLGLLPVPEVALLVVALLVWPALAIIGIHRHFLLRKDQRTAKTAAPKERP